MPFLIVLQSCDDEWIFDIPGCMDESALNYDSNATSDNGSCYYYTLDIDIIDARDYYNWVYFSFSSGQEVTISNPEDSDAWDIAFKRNNIKTNGGLSGVGDVCAIVDDSQTWTSESFESMQEIPNNECQVDEVIEGNDFTYQGCYNPDEGHIFEDCVKNPALDKWGWFDHTYHFNITNFQLFMRITNGIYIKFWPMSYYNTNQESGQISFVYQIIPNE